MDAQAYLMRHGWSGPGNPLQPNTRPGPHGGLGLTRPILVARKANNHGVGKKTTKDPTNQWWLRGFEDALKSVGDESHEGVSARAGNALTSELYRNFVRGTALAGTLNPKDGEKTEAGIGEKRKRGDEEVKATETKEERRTRRAAKKERKEKRAVARDAKKERKEKRAFARAERSKEREAKKAAKKAKKEKDVAGDEDYPTPMSIDSGSGSGSGSEKTDVETVIKDKKEKKTKSDSEDSKKDEKDRKEKKEKKRSESKA
ncbi:uncharacterized protein N7511_004971 [Penicillium nucicola]|uniref:uncharacterized protein n=1 Tax=Penicillium nucicola TaxID=1850975 RepID=UPI0025457C73|nr:uncharacterized protein N7511_004971 [Penicillium nucicola]KAJ5767355.1 hypothetical protein N7511_004971 [Penicillium nucicola]